MAGDLRTRTRICGTRAIWDPVAVGRDTLLVINEGHTCTSTIHVQVIGLMASEAPYNSVDNHGFWGTAHAENIRRTHRRDLLAS